MRWISAAPVRVLQALAGLRRHVHGLGGEAPALAHQVPTVGLFMYSITMQRRASGSMHRVVDLHDVGVHQLGGRQRLAPESRGSPSSGGAQQLDRDPRLETPSSARYMVGIARAEALEVGSGWVIDAEGLPSSCPAALCRRLDRSNRVLLARTPVSCGLDLFGLPLGSVLLGLLLGSSPLGCCTRPRPSCRWAPRRALGSGHARRPATRAARARRQRLPEHVSTCCGRPSTLDRSAAACWAALVQSRVATSRSTSSRVERSDAAFLVRAPAQPSQAPSSAATATKRRCGRLSCQSA